MPTVLITGANRGLGLEFATQYAGEGWKVVACCRDPAKAEALKKIPGIRVEALDVADDDGIAALAAKLKDEAIDLLINNAGIYSGAFPTIPGPQPEDNGQDFGGINAESWAKVLRVNAIAPIMIAQAFAANVARGEGKKIVNITSRMGSLTEMQAKSGHVAYRSSKAALNGAMRAIANDLRGSGISIINLHPGWVRTDMGGKNADLAPEQSVAAMRKTIAALTLENSGSFLNYDGQMIPW